MRFLKEQRSKGRGRTRLAFSSAQAARCFFNRESGSSILLLLLVGAIDMGRACYAAIEVCAAANAGAEYGPQNPTDTSGIQNAASLNTPNLNGLTSTAS